MPSPGRPNYGSACSQRFKQLFGIAFCLSHVLLYNGSGIYALVGNPTTGPFHCQEVSDGSLMYTRGDRPNGGHRRGMMFANTDGNPSA